MVAAKKLGDLATYPVPLLLFLFIRNHFLFNLNVDTYQQAFSWLAV